MRHMTPRAGKTIFDDTPYDRRSAEAHISFDYAELTGRTKSDILREFIRGLEARLRAKPSAQVRRGK